MPQWIDSLDDEVMVRRQQDFRGGVNEFMDAANLGDLQVQRLENAVIEDNGVARTRGGADALGGSSLAAARIDSLVYFDTPSAELLLAAVSASLRKWDASSWTTIGSYPFGASSIVEMAQGNNVVYTSIGSGPWYSWDGTAWSSSLGSGATDPPNGASIFCWHTNRMFAAGTIAGLYDQIFVSNLGNAGAGQWNSSIWAFRVGRGEGEAITALSQAKSWWLAVAKEGSIYMVYANPQAITAADWPVARLAGSVGCIGKRALVSFGDFLVVLGRDGLRKISTISNEDNPWEISPPFSEPMQPYIERINWSSANKSILHKYRHYLLCAIPLDNATEPSHVLVWNSRLGVWMGVWTAWTPTAIATTRFAAQGERLAVGDSTGRVNAWKDYASLALESTFEENGAQIPTRLRAKAWNFDAPLNWKDASFGEVIATESSGNVRMAVFLDGVEHRPETKTLFRISNQLPLSLPFDLATINPEPLTLALDGLPEFREAYLAVETASKKIQIKSMALGAFLNTLKNE